MILYEKQVKIILLSNNEETGLTDWMNEEDSEFFFEKFTKKYKNSKSGIPMMKERYVPVYMSLLTISEKYGTIK